MLHILAADLLILFLFPADEGHSTAIAPALRLLAGRSQANRQPYKPAYPCRSLHISAFTLTASQTRHNHRVNIAQCADNNHGIQHLSMPR